MESGKTCADKQRQRRPLGAVSVPCAQCVEAHQATTIEEVEQVVKLTEAHSHYGPQVVLLVTLDVRNAFNSAGWCDILEVLENRFHAPDYLLQRLGGYLKNRGLLYETREG